MTFTTKISIISFVDLDNRTTGIENCYTFGKIGIREAQRLLNELYPKCKIIDVETFNKQFDAKITDTIQSAVNETLTKENINCAFCLDRED